jgi:hypothetical protein
MSFIKIRSTDVFDSESAKDSSFTGEINLYDKVNECFNKVFELYPEFKPTENITQKDFDIVNSFTNEKSFEKSVDVCLRILAKYANQECEKLVDDDESDDSVTRDSQIIVTCMNQLIDCKVPHHYKPGFLILLVRYCYFS